MNENERGFFKKIEGDLVKWLLATFLTAVGIGVAFYFNTTSTLKSHEDKIEKIDTHLSEIENKVGQIIITPAINTEQIKTLQEDVRDIKDHLNNQDERQIKMYDMVNEIYQNKK